MIRTCDLLVPNQALYQAELRPDRRRDKITDEPFQRKVHLAKESTLFKVFLSITPAAARNCRNLSLSDVRVRRLLRFNFFRTLLDCPKSRVRNLESVSSPWSVFGHRQDFWAIFSHQD